MTPSSARMPFDTGRTALPAAVVIATLAAGGAAISGLALIGDVPAALLLLGAAVAAGLGAAGTAARSWAGVLLSQLLALPLAFVGSMLLSLASGLELPAARALPVAVVAGVPVALVCGTLVCATAGARFRPAHDALDRTLTAASTWLLLMVGGSGALAVFVRRAGHPYLGAGGLTRGAQIVALGLGAAMAASVLLRDRGRRRWLAGVLAGTVPGWHVVPRDQMPTGASAAVLPFVGVARAKGALVRLEAEGQAPFRRGQVSSVAAWVPLTVEALARALRGRGAWAAVLCLAQGTATAALLGSWWEHRRPLEGVVEVAAGDRHACARLAGGTVQCWGRNDDAQLGDGTREDRDVAGAVAGLHDVVEIAADGAYTCARRSDGTVACWGRMVELVPVDVRGVSGATRIAVRRGNACAIGQGGEIWCWVANATHKGDDDQTPRLLREPVRKPVIGLAIQDWWVCVRTEDDLSCQDLPDLPRKRDALDGVGAAPCVPGTGSPWRQPAGEPAPVAWSLVPDGGRRVCELTVEGRTRCWGNEQRRGSMDPGPCNRGEIQLDIPAARRIALPSETRGCLLAADGTVACWNEEHPPRAPLLSGAVSLAAGIEMRCAARADGTAWCWGRDEDFGGLGDGTRRGSVTPVEVKR